MDNKTLTFIQSIGRLPRPNLAVEIVVLVPPGVEDDEVMKELLEAETRMNAEGKLRYHINLRDEEQR